MKYLVTGCAGFIGFWTCKKLLGEGHEVVGVDNVNDYYSVKLKEDRLAQLQPNDNFLFEKLDVSHQAQMETLFSEHAFDCIIHLAAQAGVRYSLENPHAYIQSNLVGFTHILEGARHTKVGHLVYASSSSVYGANKQLPFSVSDNVDHPVSLYAATKKANELMAHSYAHLYQVPVTGLRFFTVYGPWGRPDMALFKFVKAILNDETIDVYNQGDMVRDFTFVDDIVEGVTRIAAKPASPNPSWSGLKPDPGTSYAPFRVYNIGNSDPVYLMDFIKAIEQVTNKKATLNLMPMQPGDVPATHADVSHLEQDFEYRPNTSIEQGVARFVDWYRQYYEQG